MKGRETGKVDLKVPGLEATFPASHTTAMWVIISLLVALSIIIPVCCYEIVNARPEALEEVGNILGRKPDKVPVQTGDGIEMIEVCPPCPICEDLPTMGTKESP